MLVEYRITYHSDGVTISQRIETKGVTSSPAEGQDRSASANVAGFPNLVALPENAAAGATPAAVNPPAQSHDPGGAGPGGRTDIGSGGPGDSPIVILGAVVVRPRK